MARNYGRSINRTLTGQMIFVDSGFYAGITDTRPTHARTLCGITLYRFHPCDFVGSSSRAPSLSRLLLAITYLEDFRDIYF